MIEIEIVRKIEEFKPVNIFEIEVEMMHGDADHYSTDYVRVPEDRKDLLEGVLRTLKQMKDLPWNDARERYSKLPYFLVYFGSEYLGNYEDSAWPKEVTREMWDEIGNYTFEWQGDITYFETYARLDGYSVYYYNKNGEKYEVDVTVVEDIK